MQRHVLRATLVLFMAYLFGCATTPAPVQTRIFYSDDGISELSAPTTWSPRANFGKSATLRITDGGQDSYLLVISYLPQEIKPTTLPTFAQRLTTALRDNLSKGKMSEPRQLTINGRPAVEYEVSGYVGDAQIVYLSTVLEGKRATYHHLITWTSEESYSTNRGTMREIVASFRESAAPRRAKARIDLTFKWPKQAKAKIEFYSKESKRGELFETRGRGVTTVRPLGNERLLVSTKVTGHKMTSNAKDKAKTNYLQNLLKEAMTGVPDYVVSTDGDFIKIENLPAYHQRIEQAILKGLPGGKREAREKAQQLVKSLLSEQMLAAMIQSEWENAVGSWAGGSYVLGQTYQFASLYQAPALGNQVFPMSVTQKLAGNVPCQAGGKANSCVRLEQTSRVADPSFTNATNQFVRKTVGGGIVVDNVDVVKTVVVITDPKTMLPYDVHVTETKNVVVSADGKAQTSKEVQESRTVYAYSK
jgi:hypothetical protein